MKIKTALILCAGLGKRVLPLSLETPKPLLKLNNITLLENTINLLEALKIENITAVDISLDKLKEVKSWGVRNIFNPNKPPDKLDILTEEEKNSIYDELISSLNMKNKNELLSYYTKYDLSKYYAEKGEVTPKFNYEYIRGFQNLDFQSENVMQDMINLNKKVNILFF